MARFRRFRPLPKLFWLSALVMFLAVGVVLVQQRQIINSDAASNGCKLCLKNVDNPKECDSLCKPKYGGCKYDKDCKEGFACKGTVCKLRDKESGSNSSKDNTSGRSVFKCVGIGNKVTWPRSCCPGLVNVKTSYKDSVCFASECELSKGFSRCLEQRGESVVQECIYGAWRNIRNCKKEGYDRCGLDPLYKLGMTCLGKNNSTYPDSCMYSDGRQWCDAGRIFKCNANGKPYLVKDCKNLACNELSNLSAICS